jgi:cyclophilin family peptidyl-prolyl cis-trans isomerase
VGTAKRERQKAGRQARLDQARAAQARRHRLRLVRNLVILAVVLVVGLFLYGKATAEDDDSDEDVSAEETTSTSAEDATPATVDVTLPPPGETVEGDTACPPADGSAPRTTTFAQPPPMCIDAARTYTAEVVTSKGSFTITLDDEAAPQTVNNFVVLARYHLYDGLAFHRIIPGFVIQTGDPVGPEPGQGGPGYAIPDELPTGDSPYVEGTVAMANSGPDTGGSQWFVVVGDGGQQLQPNYAAFGQVTSGIEVVRAINELGTNNQQGTPTEEVVIESITVTES